MLESRNTQRKRIQNPRLSWFSLQGTMCSYITAITIIDWNSLPSDYLWIQLQNLKLPSLTLHFFSVVFILFDLLYFYFFIFPSRSTLVIN